MPEAGRWDRRHFLGGSDMGAILGVDPYRTRLDVFEEKMGLREPFEGNNHTARGTRLEQVAAEEFMARTGRKLRRQARELVHPQYDFIRGHIDRRVVGEEVIAEIKCPSLGSWSKIKRTGLSPAFIVQLQQYLGLAGVPEGLWIVFCADQWDSLDIPIAFDGALYAQMIEAARQFWHDHILTGTPPATEGKPKVEVAAVGGTTREVALEGEGALEAVHQLYEAKQLAAEAELLEAAAREQLLSLVNNEFGVYTGPGFRISYSATKGRSSFDKAALAKAKPIDRDRLIAELATLPVYDDDIDDIIQKATLDLSRFEKQGNPGTLLRPTFYTGE